MRFDDRIRTVLAWEAGDPAGRVRLWRQLVDLLGAAASDESPACDLAYARLADLDEAVGETDRQSAAAQLIGRGLPAKLAPFLGLKMPVESITGQEALDYFGVIAPLAAIDLAASSSLTRRQLGWETRGQDLLTDLREVDWTAA